MLDPALRRGLVLVVVQFDPGDNATCPERETTLDALYALRRFTWSPLVDIPGRIRDSTLARRAVRELKATAA